MKSGASYDAIVIGAGASGLAAAAALARAGASALVLEARERIGGRIWSAYDPTLPVPAELGAEFVHGRAPATFALLARAGSAAVDTGGEHWTLRDGALAQSEDLFSNIRRAMQKSAALERRDLSFDEYLDRHMRSRLPAEAVAYARTLAQGFDAADTRRASARAIVEEWLGGSAVGASQFRPLGGYGALVAHLAAELRGSGVTLQLETAAKTLSWKRGRVEVASQFNGRAFGASARCAIVTLPLGVLQAADRAEGAVRFSPALSMKKAALEGLAAGPVLKVLLKFRRAFWEEIDRGRYCDVAFFHAREAPFPTFWTALPVRVPLLVAWAGGPKAARLARASRERVIETALRSLGTVFGDRTPADALLDGAWLHDWQRDPYARGAYSYVTVGGAEARAALAKPLKDTLFFGGEAADSEGEAGTVAGALQSGERAAREALAVLGRKR
jgi:monoamine oxidase